MIKYDEYALERWISTELTPGNQFYEAKMEYSRSVFHRLVTVQLYREILVPHRETVRLFSKP